MPTVASVTAMFRRNGRLMTLRRVTNGAANIDVDVYGISQGATPEDIVSNVTQQTSAITIGAAEILAAGWPAPPRSGDRIIRDGRAATLQGDAEAVYLRGVVAKYVLMVKGA